MERNTIYYINGNMDLEKNRSCETQLLECTDDVSKNLEEGKQTDVLVMDFAKAFDKVCHSLLLLKLDLYGIQGKTNIWMDTSIPIWPKPSCRHRRIHVRLRQCTIGSPSRVCVRS